MLTETWVIFQRGMRQQLRNPVWVFFGLTQPILYLVLFGPLLKNVSGGGLGGNASWSVFVPGLLLQLCIFTGGFAGFGIIQELREGVVERQRVTPARRLSLILGRSLGNTVSIGVQALILCLVAIPFGLDASVGGVALSVVVIMLLTLGVSSASYAGGLILKDEDSFAPLIQGVSLPAMLLSGVFLPMALAPDWLRHLSQANPLTYSLDALRALFHGDLMSRAVAIGTSASLAMAGLLLWWGSRAFQRSSG
ncbi:MAG: ABC transporter permease [Actinomycetota bacterium]|nr:ABC transporter permease [Actinomycetota bacterium]